MPELAEPPATIKCESVLESELVQKGAMFTPLELRLPENMEMQDWADIGRKLLRADQVMQWWIGDWAAFGAGNSDRNGWRKKGFLKEFCEANGFRAETAADHAWVSRSIHTSLRKENLTWSYYKEVAPLKPKEQMKWLKIAETEHLPVSELRKRIRRSGAQESGYESDGPAIPLLTCPHCGAPFLERLKKQSNAFWTPDHKAFWRRMLEPMAKFWEGLA